MSDRQKIHLKRLICSKAAVSKLTEKNFSRNFAAFSENKFSRTVDTFVSRMQFFTYFLNLRLFTGKTHPQIKRKRLEKV